MGGCGCGTWRLSISSTICPSQQAQMSALSWRWKREYGRAWGTMWWYGGAGFEVLMATSSFGVVLRWIQQWHGRDGTSCCHSGAETCGISVVECHPLSCSRVQCNRVAHWTWDLRSLRVSVEEVDDDLMRSVASLIGLSRWEEMHGDRVGGM